MKIELFPKISLRALENTTGDMRMLSDLQLVYMVPRNSIQLLNINTTKFQVEREPITIAKILQGGGKNLYRFVGGLPFGDMPPLKKKLIKWCNFVRFGVYFDQILSLKFFLNYHFLYNIFLKTSYN